MQNSPSRHMLRLRLRQLILMRETGPKRPAWHMRRMQLIWGLHDALAALDGGLTPEFPRTLHTHLSEQIQDYLDQLHEFCAESNATKTDIDRAAEWVARWGRQRNWELMRWKDASTPDSIAFRILGKGGPRILLVVHHDDATIHGRAAIVAALYAMAALEECGGLGAIGCLTLISGGDGTSGRRVLDCAMTELMQRHDCVITLGPSSTGTVHINAHRTHDDAWAALLQQSSLAVGAGACVVAPAPATHEHMPTIPVVTGLGPVLAQTTAGIDESSIAAQTALIALFCARLATVFAH